MISLIMRVHNRLEHTTRVMNALARQYHAPAFNVVVVDNASDDGTREWFKWIKANEGTREWFPDFTYVRSDENVGDWGGMVEGAKHVPPGAKYIGQLDNDIQLPPAALALCTKVLDAGMAKVVMLKRAGVRSAVGPAKDPRQHTIDGSSVELQPVPFCVAFWLTAAENFQRVEDARNCRVFTTRIGDCQKITSTQVVHIEGWGMDGSRSYVQKMKYDLEKWQLARKKELL